MESYPLEAKYFGEGLTIVKDKAIQLTYKARTGFVYDVNDLSKPPTTFSFTSTTNEGWGLTYDPHHQKLIMSDGSKYLHFWDPDTFQELRKVEVKRQKGAPSDNLNELEFWHGLVLCNVSTRRNIMDHPSSPFRDLM